MIQNERVLSMISKIIDNNNNIYSLSKNSAIENTEVVQIKESNLSEILNMIKQHQAIIDYILMQTGITIPEYLN